MLLSDLLHGLIIYGNQLLFKYSTEDNCSHLLWLSIYRILSNDGSSDITKLTTEECKVLTTEEFVSAYLWAMAIISMMYAYDEKVIATGSNVPRQH